MLDCKWVIVDGLPAVQVTMSLDVALALDEVLGNADLPSDLVEMEAVLYGAIASVTDPL
jgi:hypothetical protein